MTSNAKIQCFVSYADGEMDHQLFDYVVKKIEGYGRNRIQLLTDKRIKYGASFSDYMRHINDIGVVIIFLTPEYKRKVAHRLPHVHQEFSSILERMDGKDDLKHSRDGAPEAFLVIPILLAGSTSGDSVPDRIRNEKYVDVRGANIFPHRHRRQAFDSDKYTKNHIDPLLHEIAEDILEFQTQYNPDFGRLSSEQRQRLIDDSEKLFSSLKANWHSEDADRASRLFVKTAAYKNVHAGNRFLVVGRKGSGKSTIAEWIDITGDRRYKGVVSVLAESFDLNTPYQMLPGKRESGRRSELGTVMPFMQAFRFAWELFIAACCMDVLIELEETGDLRDSQVVLMPPVRGFLADLLRTTDRPGDAQRHATYFQWAIDETNRFADHCVTNARSDRADRILSDVKAAMQLPNLLRFALNSYRDDVDTFQNFKEILHQCSGKRKVLFSLDGFDRDFDAFRKDVWTGSASDDEELARRAEFEIQIVDALVITALQALEHPSWELHQLMQFCLLLPADRYLEARRRDRDGYQLAGRVTVLGWSAIELAILLRKRIEELTEDFKTSKTDRIGRPRTPQSRLHEALATVYPAIPRDINVIVNGERRKFDTFAYILQFTFWRPRDVLMYYANLTAAAMMQPSTDRLTSESVQEIVRITTKQVLEKEFYPEFESVVPGLRKVIDAFEGHPQTLERKELEHILYGRDVKFAYGSDIDTVDDKITFLWGIGFLGIAERVRTGEQNYRLERPSFVFNSGNATIEDALKTSDDRWSYVVHPIFIPHLRLSKERPVVMISDSWKELKDREIRRNTVQQLI